MRDSKDQGDDQTTRQGWWRRVDDKSTENAQDVVSWLGDGSGRWLALTSVIAVAVVLIIVTF